MNKMSSKDLEGEPQPIRYLSQDGEEGQGYHWVYATRQGHDIDVHVIPTEHDLYTIATPWYQAQVRTYDLLDTVVRFCQGVYGAGILTITIT